MSIPPPGSRRQPAVRTLPGFRFGQKSRVSKITYEFERLPVFTIFPGAIRQPSLDDPAGGEIGAVGAGLKASIPETAQLDPAFRTVDVPPPRSIAQLAAPADPVFPFAAGPAKGAAAADMDRFHLYAPLITLHRFPRARTSIPGFSSRFQAIPPAPRSRNRPRSAIIVWEGFP